MDLCKSAADIATLVLGYAKSDLAEVVTLYSHGAKPVMYMKKTVARRQQYDLGAAAQAAPVSPSAAAESVVSVVGLNKTFDDGFTALRNVDLDIRRGEIFALLGPNGAGKTTLINIICGLSNISSGQVQVAGYDVNRDYRETRKRIGLVPQELATNTFENVFQEVSFSRRLFGKPADPAYVEKILRQLSLWDKKDSQIRWLSGGMKRRLLIAKALSHEPDVLFLDEPTAGVDVELRHDMWQMVNGLRDNGVTIILTTHYIEEAEGMADRVGVILGGEIILVENKSTLMDKLGEKRLTIELLQPLSAIPAALAAYPLTLADDGKALMYTYHPQHDEAGVPALLQALHAEGIAYVDLNTQQSSLEEIFVNLVERER